MYAESLGNIWKKYRYRREDFRKCSRHSGRNRFFFRFTQRKHNAHYCNNWNRQIIDL